MIIKEKKKESRLDFNHFGGGSCRGKLINPRVSEKKKKNSETGSE